MPEVTVEFVGYDRDGDKVFTAGGDRLFTAASRFDAESMVTDAMYCGNRLGWPWGQYETKWGPIIKEKPDA